MIAHDIVKGYLLSIDNPLTRTHSRVLLSLSLLMNSHERAPVTLRDIAIKSGLSRCTVIHSITFLSRTGYIIVDKNNGRCSIYSLSRILKDHYAITITENRKELCTTHLN